MSPRPAKSASASYLHSDSILHWLQPKIAYMLKAGCDQFEPVVLGEDTSSLSDAYRADLAIKRFAASQGYNALERRLIERYRQAWPPMSKESQSFVTSASSIDALEHNWRQAEVMQAILEPIAKLIRLESEELKASKRDSITRCYHPTVECYRHFLEPSTRLFGEALNMLPKVYSGSVDFQAYRQHVVDAFQQFKKAAASKDFKKRLEAHRRRSHNAQKSFKRYADALIKAYSGLCVIYLDIGGGLAIEKERPLADVRKDFNNFLQKVANRTFNDKLAGYFWHLQKSHTRRYHYHCFFLFRPEQADYWGNLRKQLGQLWNDDITHKRGIVYHPFVPKDLAQDHVLLRPDQPLIQNQGDDTYNRLMTMVQALIHSDEVTRLELPSGVRNNGRSQMPKTSA